MSKYKSQNVLYFYLVDIKTGIIEAVLKERKNGE